MGRMQSIQASQAVQAIQVGVGPVSFEDLVRVAREEAPVALTDEALAAIDHARGVIEKLAAAETPAYGISTGFGALATKHIPREQRAQLQRSLVRSHAAGSGPEVEARGRPRHGAAAAADDGDRPHRRTPRDRAAYAALLNAGITPVVGSTAPSAAQAISPRWRTSPSR